MRKKKVYNWKNCLEISKRGFLCILKTIHLASRALRAYGKFLKFWSSINLPTFSEIKDYEISLIFCLIGIQCYYKNTAATWSKDEVHHVLWDYTHTSFIQEFVEHPQYNVEKILNDVALVHLPKNSIPAYTSRKPWK